jgi:hypothetical protein
VQVQERRARCDLDGAGDAAAVATAMRSAGSKLRDVNASSELHCSLYVVVQQSAERVHHCSLVELRMRMSDC